MPAQPAAVVGVTVIVAVCGDIPLFTAMKLGILPGPVAARPILVLLFVQLNIVPATVPVKFTAAVAAPLHSVWLATAATVAFGFTVIVNVIGAPVQPLAVGVTVIVPLIAVTPALVAVKLGILPVPDAARPILVLLLVQLKVVPATAPEKVIAVVVAPLHNAWLATVFTVGVGFTVIVNVTGVPVQVTPPLLYVGVTVIVATTGVVPLFIAVKLAILPVPLAASPMEVLLLVQLYTVPAALPENTTAAVGAPLHTVWFAGAFTVGVGFTVIVNVIAGPVQVTPALV
jgi:hypothetical protein